MKRLLLLGSVAGPCPPKKQGGTERVAYVQAKELARLGIPLIFVGGVGTVENFSLQLDADQESHKDEILRNIEFIEIGGGTQAGNADGALKLDPAKMESSRLLRLEMVYLSQVQQLLKERAGDYECILNNMRGEAILMPTAKELGKPFINVMHLPIFPELAAAFIANDVQVITISDSEREGFSDLSYAATIYNPVNTKTLSFNADPKDYALNISTIGYHKNQKEVIQAAEKAGIPLILAGKIRDNVYFEEEIQPYIDGKKVTYLGEVGFEEKSELYRNAKVFLFPILWNEPFGLVMIESLACGTPVIAYPHGGPKEIIKDGETGFLVSTVEEMAEKIKMIDSVDRSVCRRDIEARFTEDVIGKQYYDVLMPFLT